MLRQTSRGFDIKHCWAALAAVCWVIRCVFVKQQDRFGFRNSTGLLQCGALPSQGLELQQRGLGDKALFLSGEHLSIPQL